MLQCPSKPSRLLGHLSFMATESARLRQQHVETQPHLVEYTRREIADDWIKNLKDVDLETLYSKLPEADEETRRSWKQEVESHPFEIERGELLEDFTRTLDLRAENDDSLAQMKRKLMIDLVEHKIRPFAERAGKTAEILGIGMIEEAKAFSRGSLSVLRDQMKRPLEEIAREHPALREQAQEVAGKAVPEASLLFLIGKEEGRRAGKEDEAAFSPAVIEWFRENPKMFVIQARTVDPETADINQVKERAAFPPKEATYVLSWLRQAGDDQTPEHLRKMIDTTYPKEAFEDTQKRAALGRVLAVLEGYPQSMYTPQDIGLPAETEREGRPMRMFVQLRRNIDDDAKMIPGMRVRNQEHTRFQDRAAKDYNHNMEVYVKQTLPRLAMHLVREYDALANAKDMHERQQAARRLALYLSERIVELTGLDYDDDGRVEISDESQADEHAATATRKIVSFLEGVHRSWHGDGTQVTAFLDGIRDDIHALMRHRLLRAFYTREIENGSLESAEKYGTRRKLAQGAIERYQRNAFQHG